MARFHLHLLSDSTGETLEMIAKAALAQFDDSDVLRHFWPMVRSQQHLDRIMGEIAANPGLVFFTLVNEETRGRLEERCQQLGLPGKGPVAIITDLCIMEPEAGSNEFIVTSLHPGVTREQVIENTGWAIRFAEQVGETVAPTDVELEALRALEARTAAAHGQLGGEE